jgi:hypothetical protein
MSAGRRLLFDSLSNAKVAVRTVLRDTACVAIALCASPSANASCVGASIPAKMRAAALVFEGYDRRRSPPTTPRSAPEAGEGLPIGGRHLPAAPAHDLQTRVRVEPIDALVIYHPSFLAQFQVDHAGAVAAMTVCEGDNPVAQAGIRIRPRYIATALQLHRKTQLEARLKAGEKWRDTGLEFCTRTGGPLQGLNVTRAFQRLIKQAGLPRRRFHDLRHTAASFLLCMKVHPRVVADFLGH